MDHQDLINICVSEQSEDLLFSDLSGHLIFISQVVLHVIHLVMNSKFWLHHNLIKLGHF